MDNQAWFWPRTLLISVLWLLYVFISTPVQSIGFEGALTILGYALISLLVATLGGTAFFLGLRNLFKPSSRSVIIAVRALSVGVSGAVAGAIVIVLSNTGAYAGSLSPAAFILVPVIAAPICLFGFDVITETRIATLARREELVREAADLIATSASQAAIMADIRASIMTAVDQELTPVRTQVARQLELLRSETPDMFGGQGDIHDAAHNSVRPLIDRLSASDIGTPERLGLIGVVLAIIRTQPFRPIVLAVIFIAASIPTLALEDLPTITALSAMLGVALIFVILGSANRAMRHWPQHHSGIFITGFIALQIPTVIDIAIRGQDLTQILVSALASVLASAVVVLLTSGFTSWKARQETAQQTFRDLLDQQRIESLARSRIAGEVAREAAQNLHGPVQARLTACAVAMELASQAGDTNAYREALSRAQLVLDAPLFATQGPESGLEVLLQAVAEPWRGLVDVVIEVPHIDLPFATQMNIEKVVEEALTNAVRHGSARRVYVNVTATNEIVTIEVDDDGVGPTWGGDGLGSAL
ncbi:MAG: sensor histidine kinase, partial [Candidatus Nanopelagicales bacterium]